MKPLKLQAGVFYGDAARSMNAPGFRFTESSYLPDLDLPPHSHELAHFCLVLKGHYLEHLGRTCEERRPSMLIFYPPDTVHSEASHTGGRHFLIEVESWRAEDVRASDGFQRGPFVLDGSVDRCLANRLLREFRDRDDLSSLALESLALELTVSVARNHSGRARTVAPTWLLRVKDILHSTFVAPPGLNELATMVDVHPVHVARLFRRFERCTISEYVRRLRVDDARHRIAASHDSLAEIALSSGFSDQSHFCRSFKRVTGLTPAQFRKLIGRR